VLLISVDGMHSLDYQNCAKGIPGVNGDAPYCPNLAALGATGTTYLNASTSKPSDSLPGLMALISGGAPRSVGAFYDVAYDRSLAPPKVTTGNELAGGPCGHNPPGTPTELDEGIDIDQTQLNGGAPSGDGGINSIDPNRLERDPRENCAPVYHPWNFVRTNTIFGVIHQAGGYTAWTDKHPSYSSVSGPGDGSNIDDYYSPEINSTVIPLPGIVTPLEMACDPILDPSQTGAWTDSFQNIQC
jgi:Type I phosphodiesterase / nucleotide pyrophosphatase